MIFWSDPAGDLWATSIFVSFVRYFKGLWRI
jgi:hypothetical protein